MICDLAQMLCCVIRKNSVDFLRNYEIANQRRQRKVYYDFQRGTTGIKSVKEFKIDIVDEKVIIGPSGLEKMDTK
jgi:20S proteasome subunit beta 2